MKKILVVTALCVSLIFVGCTGGKLDLAKFDNWFNTNASSIQTSVYLTTDLALRGNPAEAVRITAAVKKLQAAITAGQIVKVSDVQPFINAQLPKLGLLPEDMILVNLLMAKLQPAILNTLQVLNLKNPSDQLLEINAILGYVTDVSSVIK